MPQFSWFIPEIEGDSRENYQVDLMADDISVIIRSKMKGILWIHYSICS